MPDIVLKIVRVDDPFERPNLEVDQNATIAELKQVIWSWWGIPTEEQLLSYYGEILLETKNLRDYGIGKGSKILLLMQVPGLMPITVNVNGKVVPLRVLKKETILQVKEKLAQTEGNLNPRAFGLSYNSKSLNDAVSVKDCGITLNSQLVYG